jgi:hypothetical protein
MSDGGEAFFAIVTALIGHVDSHAGEHLDGIGKIKTPLPQAAIAFDRINQR